MKPTLSEARMAIGKEQMRLLLTDPHDPVAIQEAWTGVLMAARLGAQDYPAELGEAYRSLQDQYDAKYS